MYCAIRACPTSPSLESFSSDGTTAVRICRTIEAVMKGVIPNPKIATLASAPPEKVLSSPSTPLPPTCCWICFSALAFTAGAGM